MYWQQLRLLSALQVDHETVGHLAYTHLVTDVRSGGIHGVPIEKNLVNLDCLLNISKRNEVTT